VLYIEGDLICLHIERSFEGFVLAHERQAITMDINTYKDIMHGLVFESKDYFFIWPEFINSQTAFFVCVA